MTYTLSDGSTVAPGDIVELVDGPREMLIFGDRVSVHRMSVREIDVVLIFGKVPTLAHPFMLWFDAAELRRVETIECDECGELVPADASDDVDDGWHDAQTHRERETWEVTTYRGERDDVPVVQIDGGAGRVRINLNDAPVWDGDPNTDARPGAHLRLTDSADAAALDTIARALAHYGADGPSGTADVLVEAVTDAVLSTGREVLAVGEVTGEPFPCRYVLDSFDTDGTPWHRCTVHDETAISPDAPCSDRAFDDLDQED